MYPAVLINFIITWMYACSLYYRPLVMDVTQSGLKGFLMKAKRYVIPFDKCKLAMHAICGRHAVLMMDILTFHTVRFSFASSLPWSCGSHGDAALPGTYISGYNYYNTRNKEVAALLSESIVHRCDCSHNS